MFQPDEPIQEPFYQEKKNPMIPVKEKLTRKDQIANHDEQVIPAVTNKPGVYNPNEQVEEVNN